MSEDPEERDDPLRERLVSSEVIRRSRILEFRVDTIESADGRRSTRDIAAHRGIRERRPRRHLRMDRGAPQREPCRDRRRSSDAFKHALHLVSSSLETSNPR